MIYLAQPYSYPDQRLKELRFELAMKVCAKLISEGQHVYSPIVHWHNVALDNDLPTDHTFWMKHNHYMISKSNRVYVFKLDGWENSHGLFHEINYAEKCGKPIFSVDWLPSLDLAVSLSPVSKLLKEFNLDGKDNSEQGTDGRAPFTTLKKRDGVDI